MEKLTERDKIANVVGFLTQFIVTNIDEFDYNINDSISPNYYEHEGLKIKIYRSHFEFDGYKFDEGSLYILVKKCMQEIEDKKRDSALDELTNLLADRL